MKSILKIQGMHSASCKALIEDVASEIPGIQYAKVDVEGGVAEVVYDESDAVERLRKEIDDLGEYRVISVESA
ncbi:MAG: heavy metal-associated domain-containing protein [bacterium]|nr:heavy metal-associated domain-containing protein [bacterium]